MLVLSQPWTRQPQNAAALNRSSPFCVGLVAAVRPELNLELVSNQIGILVNGSTPIVSTYGRGIATNGSNQYAYVTIPPIQVRAFTMLCVALYETPATSRRVFNMSDSASADTICSIASGASTASRARLWFRRSNSGSGTSVDTTQTAYTAAPSVVIVRGNEAVTSVDAFINGVKDPTTFTPDGTQDYIWSQVSWGALRFGSSVTEYWGGSHFLSLAWNRYLSDDECQRISTNPWQIFAPQQIYIPINAAVATAPTLSDLQAASITSSSVQGTYDYAF